MVHADAHEQQALEGFPKRRGKPHPLDGLLDRLALLLSRDAEARKRLRALEGCILREMHDVERRLPAFERKLDGAFKRRLVDELVFERHGTRGVRDRGHRTIRTLLDFGRDSRCISERSAHQQELRIMQGEQRHLPSPATVGVAEEVELVHDDVSDVGTVSETQSLVGQDFGRAAHDGRLAVERHIASDHADVLAAEQLNEIEELLADKRFYRSGIEHVAPRGEREERKPQRNGRLARPRRRTQDHVISKRKRQACVFLVRPERQAALLLPFLEQHEGLVSLDFLLKCLLGDIRQIPQHALVRGFGHSSLLCFAYILPESPTGFLPGRR